MKAQKLTFPGATGELLAARLDTPDNGSPHTYALFAHCFTCTMNLKAIGNITSALTERGIAVLRFDFTGLGESEGDFADTSFSSNVADLVAAANFLAENYTAPALLIGHSFGGAAVLQAAAQIESARAVVTIAAPCDPSHVAHLLGESQAEIETNGYATVTIADRSFTITRQFLDDLSEQRMRETIRNLRRSLLIFHSPLDDIVEISNAARIYDAALHPKSFVSLDRADHLLTDPRDSQYVGIVIAAWAGRYLTDTAQAVVMPEPTAPGEVIVEIGQQGYTSVIRAGRHRMLADEPASVGGADLGPDPYGYLLSSLGACTVMTMRMYANRKKWPLEGVMARLYYQKVHARDCEDCENSEGYIDIIDRKLEIHGTLDDEQRKRLREIADRCPVHRTLHGEIKVRTELLPAAADE